MIEVKRSVELEEKVRESRAAVRSRDAQWLADHVADGGDIILYGTAPDEEWRGRDAFLALALGEVSALMDEAGISDDEEPSVECFEAGDTGWVVTHSHFRLADGSTVPIRALAILVRDEGTWKSVFASTGVLVPNHLLAPGSPLASHPT
jgi:ketosteroid isomerase-like protein